jgi:TPP-dependent 2-oxoacid decarboxylase
MGYEIPGGIGVRLAEPESDVVVMIGDGTYQMNSALVSREAGNHAPEPNGDCLVVLASIGYHNQNPHL